MYRCKICNTLRRKGEPLLRHTVYREVPYTRAVILSIERRLDGTEVKHTSYEPAKRKEIAREIPVCGGCHARLEEGVPLVSLLRQHAPEPAPLPPPPPVVNRPVLLGVPAKRV